MSGEIRDEKERKTEIIKRKEGRETDRDILPEAPFLHSSVNTQKWAGFWRKANTNVKAGRNNRMKGTGRGGRENGRRREKKGKARARSEQNGVFFRAQSLTPSPLTNSFYGEKYRNLCFSWVNTPEPCGKWIEKIKIRIQYLLISVESFVVEQLIESIRHFGRTHLRR